MIFSRPVSLALVGLFLWQTGCTSYKQIGIGQVPDHGKVRVTLRGGEREILRDPTVYADSIRGANYDGSRSVAIPLDDVVEVEAGHANVGATVALTAGIALAAAIVVAATCVDGEGTGFGPHWSC